jgi:hypothetical protein
VNSPNFAIDEMGNRVPIRYSASDLVNIPPPEGYCWRKKNEVLDQYKNWIAQEHGAIFPNFPQPWSQFDYYVADKIGTRP